MNKRIASLSLLTLAFVLTTVAPAAVFAEDYPSKKPLLKKAINLKEAKDKPFPLKVLKKKKMERKKLLRKAKPEERKKFREDLKKRKSKVKEVAKKHRVDFRKKVKSPKKRARLAVAHRRALSMLRRFRFANARLNHIIKRIEGRIKKLESEEVDISSARSRLEEVKNLQADAEDKLTGIKEIYDSLLAGEAPKEAVRKARALARELKGDLKNIRTKVGELIRALKAAGK